jgi:hypothetical protein
VIGVAEHRELHSLSWPRAGSEDGQAGQVAAGREADEADAAGSGGATVPDLAEERVAGHRVADVERVAEMLDLVDATAPTASSSTSRTTLTRWWRWPVIGRQEWRI